MNAPAVIQAARLPETQCVYMLTDGHRVKIGTTSQLEKRIASLSGACGYRLELLRMFPNAGPKVERWLHRKFASLRTHGEWFVMADEMLTVTPPEEIQSIPAVVQRRDIRLTLKERIKEADKGADDIGLSAHQRLMIMTAKMTDEEADCVVRLIRDFVERRQAAA